VERLIIVQQADPEGGQRANPAPASSVGAAHLEEALQANFGEGGREMVGPITQARLFAGQLRQLAIEERAEAFAGDVDVPALPEYEVHRHVEHVLAVALVAKAILEHEGEHARAVRVRVLPDVTAEALEAVWLAFGERRIGEQGGGDWLKSE